MTKHTKVSAKGQVVIPKDVRDRLHWHPGTELEVVDGPSGVMLRAKPPSTTKRPFKESLARLHAIADYQGPIGTDAEWKDAIDEMFRNDPQWATPKR
jgi:AbrB family looped-hinge helix DNA binding protein